MRAPIIIACLSLAVLACEIQPKPPTKTKAVAATQEVEPAAPLPAGVRVEIANRGERCRRTLCVAGPGPLSAHPNFDLNETCRRSPGVVQRCEGELCMGVWGLDEWQQGVEGLIVSLDTDADGRVTAADEPCDINLGGWSTGAGVILTALPERLAAQVDEGHARIHNLLVVAPYLEPDESGRRPAEFAVPAQVERAFIYRTTAAPEDDCSRSYDGGPWMSPPPVCGPDTTCYDYDYAQLGDELAYLGRRGHRSGQAIGHCNMSSIVAKLGLDNLARGREGYEHLIPPYASGERGGRPRDDRAYRPRPNVLPNPVQPD